MSPIRTYLKAGLDRARVHRYQQKATEEAAAVERATQRLERAKLGGMTYI